MSDIIEISRLSKRFGDVQAVNNLSFRVKEGELFAFLGINGAGKSTTINIMCGQFSKGAMGHGGKKVKNAWNIGDYQSAVLYGNGGVFSTCVSGL